MNLTRLSVVITMALGLSACFQTQLVGPTAHSSLVLTELRSGASASESTDTWGPDTWINIKGQETWDGYSALLQLLVLGIAAPDTRALDDSTLYLIKATGGSDYDADGSGGAPDANPLAVQGKWHAIASGARIKSGNLKVSALTEAIYQQVLPMLGTYSDTEILTSLTASARLLLSDVNKDGVVDYNDALVWSRIRNAGRFLGDLEALDQLAAAISAGQPAAMLASHAEAAYGSYRVTMIVTDFGTVEMETLNWDSPITVANFLDYIAVDYYDNVIFHRTINNFMIQTGLWELVGTNTVIPKDTNPSILNEAANGVSNLRGTVAMARTEIPNSASSQFFINQTNNTGLDYDEEADDAGYAVFARVLSGLAVVDTIATLPTTSIFGIGKNVPNQIVVIESLSLSE